MTNSGQPDRREVLASFGALAVVGIFPCPANAAAGLVAPPDRRLDELLSRQFERLLVREPTLATSLGIDIGARAALRASFPDWSPAGLAERKASNRADLAELRAFGREGLSDKGLVSFDSAVFQLQAQTALDRFTYHSEGFGHRGGPYVVTQLGGFYTAVPNYLDTQHPVKNKADADAYMVRLVDFPKLLDHDTALVRANAAAGVIAPRFILDQAIRQLTKLRDGDPRSTTLVRSIARRAGALGLAGYGDRAQREFEGPVRAALDQQIAALTALLPRSVEAGGVGRLPRGREYYAATLRNHTTTEMSAEEIHRVGLEHVAHLNGRIDALLKAQGYRNGSIRERLDALEKSPGQRFANTDAGRAELLAYLNERLATIRTKLPRVFPRMPTLPYEIRRVPPEIEAGTPGGSAQRGTADGTRPGIFWINLRDTAEWPRYKLPTLAFHEAAPGHLFEGALARQNGDLPLYRQVVSATAYGEGWGLYSEQVADELGMYADDPLGKIGYLASFAFRASRLVVDTGIHDLGWSREKAIAYMVANSSESPSSARTEVDRYFVYPGQAAAYMVGQMAISRLRAEAQRSPKFDLKQFHALVLDGRGPLSVLERLVRSRFH